MEPEPLILTYKYRLNPERRQHRALERILEQQRQLYNAALDERIAAWSKGISITEAAQSRSLTQIRADDPAFACVQRRIQRETLRRLDRAYKAFFRRVKEGAGASAGFPRFKGREFFDGFGFDAFQQVTFDGSGLRFAGMPGKLRCFLDRPLPPTLRFTIKKGAAKFKAGDRFVIDVGRGDGGKLTVIARPGIGNIGDGVLVLASPAHRGPVAEGRHTLTAIDVGEDKVAFVVRDPSGTVTGRASAGMAYDAIKNVWLKREGRRWFCGFQVEVPRQPRHNHGQPVGVDWGTSVLAALSTGETIPNPRPGEALAKDLARAQRAVSRKKKGSKRRMKARRHLQAINRRIANRRRDKLDKVAKRLVNHFHFVGVEDLNVKGMMDAERPGETLPEHVKRRRNREALDAAPYRLRQMLAYKAERDGALLVAVDAKNTTQECFWCGGLHFKELTDDVHTCTRPGLYFGKSAPRKVNAARVILKRALAVHAAGDGGGPVPGGAKRSTGSVCLGNTEDGQPSPGRRVLVTLASQRAQAPRPPPGRLRTEPS